MGYFTRRNYIIVIILGSSLLIGFYPIKLTTVDQSNLVADGVVTVTFVYFYEGNVEHKNWKNEIRYSLNNIMLFSNMVHDLHYTDNLEDLETFVRRYTELTWDWVFYGEVSLHEMYQLGLQSGPNYAMYWWHKANPEEAEKIWRQSDVVYGIIQNEQGGGALDNFGYVWLGSKTLWRETVEPRDCMPTLLAHELIHNFGAPDHYSPRFVSYGKEGTDPYCLYGEKKASEVLDEKTVLCEYCLGKISWTHPTKRSELSAFYLGQAPDNEEEPEQDPILPTDEPPFIPPPSNSIFDILSTLLRKLLALILDFFK